MVSLFRLPRMVCCSGPSQTFLYRLNFSAPPEWAEYGLLRVLSMGKMNDKGIRAWIKNDVRFEAKDDGEGLKPNVIM